MIDFIIYSEKFDYRLNIIIKNIILTITEEGYEKENIIFNKDLKNEEHIIIYKNKEILRFSYKDNLIINCLFVADKHIVDILEACEIINEQSDDFNIDRMILCLFSSFNHYYTTEKYYNEITNINFSDRAININNSRKFETIKLSLYSRDSVIFNDKKIVFR